MPRIRTIKPEFPQSESMGRISRDARLLFILLWTICDDAGRTRAASRMLASLLYPYDDDAAKRIDGWLRELEAENCVVRYEADGAHYLQVCNWLNHQKIDKPSASKIPAFAESSRMVAKPRERSSGDLDLDLDRDLDQGPTSLRSVGGARKRAPPRKRCPDDWKPTPDQEAAIRTECPDVDLDAEGRKFRDYEFARGRSDWPATWRNWMREAQTRAASRPKPAQLVKRAPPTEEQITAERAKAAADNRRRLESLGLAALKAMPQ